MATCWENGWYILQYDVWGSAFLLAPPLHYIDWEDIEPHKARSQTATIPNTINFSHSSSDRQNLMQTAPATTTTVHKLTPNGINWNSQHPPHSVKDRCASEGAREKERKGKERDNGERRKGVFSALSVFLVLDITPLLLLAILARTNVYKYISFNSSPDTAMQR